MAPAKTSIFFPSFSANHLLTIQYWEENGLNPLSMILPEPDGSTGMGVAGGGIFERSGVFVRIERSGGG
jgi:hypothetical protein